MIPPNRLVIGPLSGGLQTYDKPFFLNNESFPVLNNALCYRHQVIKKPGSEQLGRLEINLAIANMGATTITVTVSPASAGSPIPPGVSQFSVGSIVYSDATITAGGDPITLIDSLGVNTSTFNRTTGVAVLNFPILAGNTPVQYFPGLPVMGIENFESDNLATTAIDVANNVYFDTVYSYVFNGTIFTNNSYYKTTGTPVYWTGANYQQFYTSNYYRAMWVTNDTSGAQFVFGTYSSGSGTSAITFNFKNTTVGGATNITTLKVGDVIWFNEWNTGGSTINGKSGSVTDATGSAAGNYIVTFSSNVTVAGTGIAQLMTSSVSGQGDGIRWYDGQGPGTFGFVNFAPPLDNLGTSATTYLVGCRIIIPFGNRLLAIGTFEANSAQIFASLNTTFQGAYYGNRIRYCEVTATPFYSAPIPNGLGNVPGTNIEPNAWASNIQGFGGFIDLDTTERIISASITQGVMVFGLESEQRRMSNTGIETDPFSLEVINPEFGTSGTHAFVPMDKGILTAGEYGFITTSSYDAQRFDVPIIQQVFQVNPEQNGYERICGGRDFVNEVVYFSYNSVFNQEDTASNSNTFPDTTLVYNYRENSFGVWYETPTTYGLIKLAQKTWSALTDFVWNDWNNPWNSQASVSNYPFVGIGTPQGFVMLKWANPSANDSSLTIQNSVSVTADIYTITSVNHNLSSGMYLGFFPPSAGLPSFIGRISNLGDSTGANPVSLVTVEFNLADPATIPSNIVPGTWQMSIIDQPFIQTKQFQMAWANAKKTRIGAQKYFLDTTESGEFTVEILGSQSPVPLNNNTIANPEPSLISNAIVRTRPDDSVGLYGTQAQQQQIWHRLASSVIGDTVQLQMSFSDAQMRNVDIATSPWVLHSVVLDLYPSRTLA